MVKTFKKNPLPILTFQICLEGVVGHLAANGQSSPLPLSSICFPHFNFAMIMLWWFQWQIGVSDGSLSGRHPRDYLIERFIELFSHLMHVV